MASAFVSAEMPRPRAAHLVSANRLGNILDAMAAKRAVIKIELVFDLLVDSV